MKVVIVGAGQAAASLAAKLRALGHEGEIVVIGAEPVAPYQRPPLSKGYLLGEMGVDRLTLRAEDWWAENGITLRLGILALAVEPGRLVTDAGDERFDALALTLGATPRHLPAAMGGHLEGVHTVRSLADVDAMADQFAPGRRLVVIGGGYIGLEAAAVARKLGLEVTLVEAAPRILGRVAAAETADMIRALHRSHGVTIIEGTGITRIEGETRASGVTLTDGRHLPADFVILGIGVTPDSLPGVDAENGILTDDQGRTSLAGVWAAGDCASFPHEGGRLRLESVGNAIDMAELVAENILGADKPYRPKPWFWSDQFDAKLQIAGWNAGYDLVVTRPAEGGGSVWYWRNDRLIAVDALNDARAYMIGKRLIDAGRSVTPEAVRSAADLKVLL